MYCDDYIESDRVEQREERKNNFHLKILIVFSADILKISSPASIFKDLYDSGYVSVFIIMMKLRTVELLQVNHK